MKLGFSISLWYAGLQARERRAIGVGALVGVLALVFSVIQPHWQLYRQLSIDVNDRRADLAWLAGQVAEVDRLRSSCSGRPAQSGSERDIVSLLVRRNQVRLIDFSTEQGPLSLRVSAASANDILALLGQLACAEYSLTSVIIERQNDAAGSLNYEATIGLRRVD